MLLLFVCTSNTCRSPMAEALAKHWLTQHPSPSVRVRSLALSDEFEPPGSPASAHGVAAMARRGIDMQAHRSRLITKDLVDEADVIYCVTVRHASLLRERFPDARAEIAIFPADIADPWHQDEQVYEACARQIQEAVNLFMPTLLQRWRK
ncbi:hypothetical protein ACHHYP_20689 [Achlya hypogyna]|uniref:acid phosphatase n=1 Tax=Achlya hypogyna TaxID=1202772 RepID=A0A1V9ZFN0_ACHHY|nr:hypothetical protein ACHHYP_20689 [Achlya hypogyna]